MRITSLQIHNYKSFFKSDVMPFYPGFNVIVGKNNVGKTALVEALGLRFENKPHRSELTVYSNGVTPSGESIVNIVFEIGNDELLKLLADKTLHVPHNPRLRGNLANSFSNALPTLIILKCSYNSSRGAYTSCTIDGFYDGIDPTSQDIRTYVFKVKQSNLEIELINENTQTHVTNTFAYQLANLIRDKIYVFKAERLNLAQYKIATKSDLESDAGNLAQVLHHLSTNTKSRYGKLVKFVSAIFPEIKDISVPLVPDSANIARIQVWTIDPDTERDDLTIPLYECGTGIGQVLAILYVVLTSKDPRIIIIDEPQSFLHPGAIRKLIDILRQEFNRHQYIMTTHSPTVITSANPRSILLVRREDMQSVVEVIDVAENDKMRLYLSEIGARLSDVFGADNILWVEGATEEQCFPLILEKLANKSLMGTAIVGVKHTGDFQRKDKQLVFNIYKRLSSAKGLLPPAIGFIFDREKLSAQDCADLIRESGGTVHFISRKMYENYLLHPGAIASLMNSIQGFSEKEVTSAEIEAWLNTEGGKHKLDIMTPRIWTGI